ncbi:hypothetical protein yfred0001_7470 [Yersinia frederiksenii ATCC 33641]|nr:hypothetical protein yfred0001_7470 [Yersinia frederiksenii ATCC 33641]
MLTAERLNTNVLFIIEKNHPAISSKVIGVAGSLPTNKSR